MAGCYKRRNIDDVHEDVHEAHCHHELGCVLVGEERRHIRERVGKDKQELNCTLPNEGLRAAKENFFCVPLTELDLYFCLRHCG